MIEELIEQHIKEKLAEAYPDFPEDQILIRVTGGDMVYEKKNLGYLGTEILKASVVVSNNTRFDRKPFVQAFPRGGVLLPLTGSGNGEHVWQEYKQHQSHVNIDAAKNVAITFFLEYKYDIEAE